MIGRYGLGDMPPCASLSVPAGFVGPLQCEGDQSAVTVLPPGGPASQADVANLWNVVGQMFQAMPGAASACQFYQTYNGQSGTCATNWGMVAALGGGMVVLIALVGRLTR